MKIEKGDFISVSFTGKLADTQHVFDTTDEATAKKNRIHNTNKTYGPIIVCVGEKQVLEGLDESFIGKQAQESYTVHCPAIKAFGKKDAKLIQLIPTRKFKEQQITPTVNTTVYVDNRMGVIRSSSGGRTLVDFNHPFANKDVSYDVTIEQKVTDPAQKIDAILALTIKEGKAVVSDKSATITTKMEVPEQFQKVLSTHIQKLVTGITNVEFAVKPETKSAEKPTNTQNNTNHKKE